MSSSPLKVYGKVLPLSVTCTLNEAISLNPLKVGLVHEMDRVVVVCPVTSRLVGGPGGTGERERGEGELPSPCNGKSTARP